MASPPPPQDDAPLSSSSPSHPPVNAAQEENGGETDKRATVILEDEMSGVGGVSGHREEESVESETDINGVDRVTEEGAEDHSETLESEDEDIESSEGALEHELSEEEDEGSESSEDEDEDSMSEDEESGGDEDEDEDEGDEDEPALKYERLRGSVTDILSRDSASALAVSDKYIALGTHNGMVFILDVEGNLVKGFRSHSASVMDIEIDTTGEFVASASLDGQVVISALSTSESYAFDFKRPMRCVALEPSFGRRGGRRFVCGGMAGDLILKEKGWMGQYRETVLQCGEGPVWTAAWRGNLIAWACDSGVRIYDINSGRRITNINQPSGSPRGDLFRCSLFWQDDNTLLIAWADQIKVAVVKERTKPVTQVGLSVGGQAPQRYVEISAIFQVDCMLAGIVPYDNSFLSLAYVTDETFGNEDTEDREAQSRKAGNRPELRIISRDGEELSSDALSLTSYARYQCNDYLLLPGKTRTESIFYVVSPKDVVIARPRDAADHITWLLERRRYEEALKAIERMDPTKAAEHGFDVQEIGRKYLSWLVEEEDWKTAAKAASKVLGSDQKAWEDCIFLFMEKRQLPAVIPHVPTHEPQLSSVVYDMVLAHFLKTDRKTLLKTIKEWPTNIYDTQAVVVAIQDQLQREPGSIILMECLAELFVANRQPSKALPYFMRLRRPNVFDLIRDYNLFTSIQDQAALLIEFDQDVSKRLEEEREKRSPDEAMKREEKKSKRGAAIDLLVDHTHSIPIPRVVAQLQDYPQYLYMYLDALFDKDAHLISEYADQQVQLYADYDYSRLMQFLRTSTYYNIEKAYNVCSERDLVPEMVFLLGRVGDNKRALTLIIERLGDVERAIDFAKEQADEELWDELLKYSETRPAFIRGLLENVGPEIDPVKLVRSIKNGLEIPGLKDSLIKILYDFNLQVSLLDGCKAVLNHDNRDLGIELHAAQTCGWYASSEAGCMICQQSLFVPSNPSLQKFPLAIVFLCRHAYHVSCLIPPDDLPPHPSSSPSVFLTPTTARAFSPGAGGPDGGNGGFAPRRRAMLIQRNMAAKMSYAARLRVKLKGGCPECGRNTTGWACIERRRREERDEADDEE